MSTVQAQHPAVVLRSSYLHMRALLALAGIVIVGLTVAVIVLAISTSGNATIAPAAHAASSTIRATHSATIGGNPDHLGPQPAPPQSGPITSYPGHF